MHGGQIVQVHFNKCLIDIVRNLAGEISRDTEMNVVQAIKEHVSNSMHKTSYSYILYVMC